MSDIVIEQTTVSST